MFTKAIKRAIPPILKERVRPVLRFARVLTNQPRPNGEDIIQDLKRRLGDFEMKTMVDVGAHHGETAARFAVAFPRAEIHCFEPNPKNYAKLAENVGHRCIVNHLAIGATTCTVSIEQDGNSDASRVVEVRSGVPAVTMTSLAQYCSGRLEHIDFLKIDAEGYDLEVLKGALPLLRTGDITVVQAECSIEENGYYVAFGDICNLLLPLGYRPFGIYNQNGHWSSESPYLRWFDAAFIYSGDRGPLPGDRR